MNVEGYLSWRWLFLDIILPPFSRTRRVPAPRKSAKYLHVYELSFKKQPQSYHSVPIVCAFRNLRSASTTVSH